MRKLMYKLIYKPLIYINECKRGLRKSLDICTTQLAGGLLLKILKDFEVMLNIFKFSHAKEILES